MKEVLKFVTTETAPVLSKSKYLLYRVESGATTLHPPSPRRFYNGETGGGFLGIIDFLCWRGSRVEIWNFFSLPTGSARFILFILAIDVNWNSF